MLLAALLACGLACVNKPVNSRAIFRAPDAGPPRGGAGPDGPVTEVDGGEAPTEPDAGPVAPTPATTASACERGDQCDTGYCVDGVCCNVACGGTCVSCIQPGQVGNCVPVPSGQPEPRGGCRQDPESSCGQTGLCNGQGGCAKHPPGTDCATASCSGPRTLVVGGECDGDGICVKGAPLECTPFNCEGDACRVSCLADTDCVPPNVCADGKCGLRGNGQACTANDQCLSTFCVDGVCCENACTGRCTFCASPASRGSCLPVREGAPDPRAAAGITDPARVCLDEGPASCGDNGRCDGEGGCLEYDDGTVCRAPRCETGDNAQFGESICEDGECESPSGTSCAPYRGCSGARCLTECSSDSRCASGFFCVDDICQKKPIGEDCDESSECRSGFCAQGRCCNEACNSPCRSCDLEGSGGTCGVRTFDEEIYTEEDNVFSAEPAFFNDGDPVPAGQYVISYVEGCIKYSAVSGWTVNAFDELGTANWWLIGAATTDKRLLLPGNVGFLPGLGGFTNFDDCVNASRRSATRTYNHPGGRLGVYLQDTEYADNEAGEDDSNPVWRISGSLTCP